MRPIKLLAAVALALAMFATSSAAQNAYDVDGPAESPPPDFQGRQFVDSNGCMFVRAGIGTKTIWAPRVTSDRKPICGQTPTFSGSEATELAATPEPYATTAAASGSAAVNPPRVRRHRVVANRRARGVPVPAGYIRAWEDDRLNPYRGRGTAEGQAAMERVWTNTVPRRLVDPENGRTIRVVKRRVSPSSQSVSSRSVQPAHRHLQISTFADRTDAERAARRLGGSGLPVRIARVERGGQAVDIVYAGPFRQRAALNSALVQVRRMGYRNAIPIR